MRDVHEARLLIVDDEPELRRMLVSILRGDGYADVHEAATAAEAMEKALRLRPDALILDVMLPDGDGFSLFRDLRTFTQAPVLFLSARDEDEARLRGLPAEEIDEALRTVRLDGQTQKPVNHFSLGMKQRLGIAAALMGRPRLLLLDEPTNGLDPSGIQEMRELIRSLPSRYGMTVIVSSHLLGEIDQMADHVGVIRQGRLVFQGTMSGLHGMSAARLALRTQDNARARSLLPAARSEGEWLLLDAMSDSEAARVSLKLAGAGIGLVRMEQRETSLEDIFLRLTGTEETL